MHISSEVFVIAGADGPDDPVLNDDDREVVSQGRAERSVGRLRLPRHADRQGPRHGIFPMVETCRELSLELMSFDVAPQQDLYTKQGVAVTVEAVAQIKVKSGSGIDPDRRRAVSDQDAAAARRPHPPGDGRPPARHHRPAHGRRDRQAAGDGRRPHALHLRRRHEQDGPRGDLVHDQGSARQERVHHQHGPPGHRAHQARCRHRRGRSRARHRHQARRGLARSGRSRGRRPTRSACWRRRCR